MLFLYFIFDSVKNNFRISEVLRRFDFYLLLHFIHTACIIRPTTSNIIVSPKRASYCFLSIWSSLQPGPFPFAVVRWIGNGYARLRKSLLRSSIRVVVSITTTTIIIILKFVSKIVHIRLYAQDTLCWLFYVLKTVLL